MKLTLKSVRIKEGTTLCGRSGTLFEAKDGFTLTADTDVGAVLVEREASGVLYDAAFVPMSNVAHYTPLSQRPAKK